MAKGEVIGTWFNSGFHGHYRNKIRSDFMCEYRNLARPQPPKTFVMKLRLPVSSAPFSKHDNRESFKALIFTEGLGKRRYSNAKQGWKPELLSWNTNSDDGIQQPAYSQNKETYRGGYNVMPLTQCITHKPKTSFDEDQAPTTSYRYYHGHGNPNRDHIINAMRNEGLVNEGLRNEGLRNEGLRNEGLRNEAVASPVLRHSIPLSSPVSQQYTYRQRRSTGRESVASCMQWDLLNESKHTSISKVPVPPSMPKPIADPTPVTLAAEPPPLQPPQSKEALAV